MSAPAVTDSGSHPEVSAVTGNACEKCERYRRDLDHNPHCRTCHSGRHANCSWCGTCLPDGHRRDRWYCSTTCRVRALQWRRSPAAAEEQRQREADLAYQDWLAAMRAVGEVLGMSEKRKAVWTRYRDAVRTGETCAVCARALGALVFWRAVDTGERTSEREDDQRRRGPVCPECAAGAACPAPLHRPFLCERCRSYGGRWEYDLSGSWFARRWSCPEAGPNHRDLYCEDCHPRQWATGRCPGCERTVMVREHGNRRWRDSNNWEAGPDRHAVQYVFCSTRCRSRVDRARAAGRRAEKRAESAPHLCSGCGEVLDGRRADAAYCSPACRQRAYRRRKGGAS